MLLAPAARRSSPTSCSARRASAARGPGRLLCPACRSTRRPRGPCPSWPTPTPAGLARAVGGGGVRRAVRAWSSGTRSAGSSPLRRPLGTLLAVAVAAATVGPGRGPLALVPVPVATGRGARPRTTTSTYALAEAAVARLRRRRADAAGIRLLAVPGSGGRPGRPRRRPSGSPTSTARCAAAAPRCAGSPRRRPAAQSSSATTCSPPAPPPARPSGRSRRWDSVVRAIATVAATRRRRPRPAPAGALDSAGSTVL